MLDKVHNREDASDVSQEVFIKIWKSLPSFRGDCKFSTWVYRIAVNTSLDFLRRASDIIPESLSGVTDENGDDRPLEVADGSTSVSPEASLERSETQTIVRRAIDSLVPEQREIVLLRDIEGYSYDDIAEMLGVSIGTVKSRLCRARTRLKEILLVQLSKK